MALFKKQPFGPAPLDGHELLLADLDGVVYRGRLPIPGAIEGLNRAARSTRLGYLTNNASRTDETVAEQLRSLGLEAMAADVVTSPQAACSPSTWRLFATIMRRLPNALHQPAPPPLLKRIPMAWVLTA